MHIRIVAQLGCPVFVGNARVAVVMNVSQFRELGYVTVHDVFTPAEIDELRDRILAQSTVGIFHSLGWSVVDFMNRPSFEFLHSLPRRPSLLAALSQLFGPRSFRYCSHNDIGIDRIVGWHKDLLNGIFSQFQRTPLWKPRTTSQGSDDGHLIVKALIYLQDHSEDDDALRVVDGSHRVSQTRTPAQLVRQLRPPKGSVVIFEQRITHRGQEPALELVAPPARNLKDRSRRVVITLGFGAENIFTEEFEAGTRARQARMVENCPLGGRSNVAPSERWARWLEKRNNSVRRAEAVLVRAYARERAAARVSREWLRSKGCPPGSHLIASERNLSKSSTRQLLCSRNSSSATWCICPGLRGMSPWLAQAPSWCRHEGPV